MTAILDRIAWDRNSFKPRTVLEFFGIQLGRALQDPDHFALYLRLASVYTPTVLADAFQRIQGKAADSSLPIAERFQHELTHGSFRGDGKPRWLLACRAERRCISLAVFYGFQLRRTEVRQLSADAEAATKSTAGFVRWALDMYPECSAAVETYADAEDTRRIILTAAVIATLRERGVPVWDVGAPELLKAYGVPQLRTRQEVRLVAERLWPELSPRIENASRLDVAALGLYIHVMRLLRTN